MKKDLFFHGTQLAQFWGNFASRVAVEEDNFSTPESNTTSANPIITAPVLINIVASPVTVKAASNPNPVIIPTGVNIYPNPTVGQFNLVAENFAVGNATVKILNVNGIIVQTHAVQIKSARQVFALNIDQATKGIYFVQIMQAGKSATYQISKQ